MRPLRAMEQIQRRRILVLGATALGITEGETGPLLRSEVIE